MCSAISASRPALPGYTTHSHPSPMPWYPPHLLLWRKVPWECSLWCPIMPNSFHTDTIFELALRQSGFRTSLCISSSFVLHFGTLSYPSICVFFLFLSCTLLIQVLSLSLQEMIIDKVNGQPVPRYLIYDIIKFNVSSPGHLRMCCLFFDLWLMRSSLIEMSDRISNQHAGNTVVYQQLPLPSSFSLLFSRGTCNFVVLAFSSW